jgi:transcriptional regulator with XRE-family HTH domain
VTASRPDTSDPRSVNARKFARPDHRELFGARLRLVAAEQGFESTRALARATGLSIGAVRTLMKGTTDPTLGTMLALVDGLGLSSVEELLHPLGTSVSLGRSRDLSFLQEQALDSGA